MCIRDSTGSLATVRHLARERPDGGAYTPATLMGADLVERLPGSGAIAVSTA